MPVLDGFSAAERIKKALPGVPILMFSMHDGPGL
jgi:CheY-like chemotaxis protein